MTDYTTIKFENGEREEPTNQLADAIVPGKDGFSNYLCDCCGCVLEVSERPRFFPDGSLVCDGCFSR